MFYICLNAYTITVLYVIYPAYDRSGIWCLIMTAERISVLYTSGELSKYRGYYVAIRDGKVIDKDKDYFKLLERLRKEFGDLTDVIIDYIPEKPVELIV